MKGRMMGWMTTDDGTDDGMDDNGWRDGWWDGWQRMMGWMTTDDGMDDNGWRDGWMEKTTRHHRKRTKPRILYKYIYVIIIFKK
jgi:hypothetical protein